MPQYRITIKSPVGARDFTYLVNLTDNQEDHPEDYFRKLDNQTAIIKAIQDEIARTISPEQLKRLIDVWTSEIKENKRSTVITIDLGIDAISSVQSSRGTPNSTSALPPPPLKAKTPTPNLSTQKAVSKTDQKMPEKSSINTNLQANVQKPDAEQKPEEPTNDTWAGTNKVDDF